MASEKVSIRTDSGEIVEATAPVIPNFLTRTFGRHNAIKKLQPYPISKYFCLRITVMI